MLIQSSTVETDCVILSEERESFKKSLIFGRQWRDALFVTYNTTSEFNLTTIVYVCYSGEQVDQECSNKFQVPISLYSILVGSTSYD